MKYTKHILLLTLATALCNSVQATPLFGRTSSRNRSGQNTSSVQTPVQTMRFNRLVRAGMNAQAYFDILNHYHDKLIRRERRLNYYHEYLTSVLLQLKRQRSLSSVEDNPCSCFGRVIGFLKCWIKCDFSTDEEINDIEMGCDEAARNLGNIHVELIETEMDLASVIAELE